MSTLEEKVDKNFEGRKIREFLKEKMGLSSSGWASAGS